VNLPFHGWSDIALTGRSHRKSETAINMDTRRRTICKETPKYSKKNLFHCHVVQYKQNTDSTLRLSLDSVVRNRRPTARITKRWGDFVSVITNNKTTSLDFCPRLAFWGQFYRFFRNFQENDGCTVAFTIYTASMNSLRPAYNIWNRYHK
jgi:hypothetical protein